MSSPCRKVTDQEQEHDDGRLFGSPHDARTAAVDFSACGGLLRSAVPERWRRGRLFQRRSSPDAHRRIPPV